MSIVGACVSLLVAVPAASAASVQYNGGPVSHSMAGVLVDWGSSVNSVYTNDTTGDPGLIKYLSASSGSTGDIGGVLAQYMDSSAHNAANQESYGGQYQITPSVTSSTIFDSQIGSELVSQIQAGNLPRPAGNGLGTIYLVLFPAGDTECIDSQTCSGSYFCAYHSGTALSDGTKVLYAVLPDNTTGPMTQGCGSARTLFQDQTSYLTHEWSETITDPLGNAWWDSSPGGTGNEIGDWCNQFMAQNGSWTVQEEWSNLDNACLAAESAYSAPTASFLAPSTASSGQPVGVDASASSDPPSNRTSALWGATSYSISSGIASYSWDWGDGSPATTGTTPAASHSFLTAGTYQVSLTVTDELGFTSTVTHAVIVSSGGTVPPSATTGAAGGVASDGATLSGQVNPEAQTVTYQFNYGTSVSSLTQSTPATAGPTGVTAQSVSATLSGLSASTTYYYQLVVTASGQSYSGAVQSFTTNAAPPAPQTPIISTATASQVAASGATLNGSVNPGGTAPVTYWFVYGTSSSSLNQTTPQANEPAGTTAVPVSAQLSGLQAGVTYYYELEASLNAANYSGQVSSFTTPVPPPAVSTGGASHITSTSASVSGTVNPAGVATRYLVEYGTSRSYGHSTSPVSAGSGAATVSVSAALAGLSARTTYHYRLLATSAGGSVVGADATFTTARAASRPPRFGFTVPHHVRAKALAARHLKVHYSCSRACIVHFVVTTVSTRLAHSGSVPLTLAHGTGRLSGAGTATSALRFLPQIPARLLHRRGLRLVISAYAVSAGSTPSAPKAKLFSVG